MDLQPTEVSLWEFSMTFLKVLHATFRRPLLSDNFISFHSISEEFFSTTYIHVLVLVTLGGYGI